MNHDAAAWAGMRRMLEVFVDEMSLFLDVQIHDELGM